MKYIKWKGRSIPRVASSGSRMLCGQLHHRNGRLALVFVVDLLLFLALVEAQIVDAYIYMLYHPDKIRLNNWCIAHVVCDDDGNSVHAGKIHDHTMDSLWFCSLDQYVRMGTLCCGMHWIVNRNSIRAFLSYRIRAKIHIDRLFYRDHATNAYIQSFDRRGYDEMDMMHLVDIRNHRYYCRIDTRPLWILCRRRKNILIWNHNLSCLVFNAHTHQMVVGIHCKHFIRF